MSADCQYERFEAVRGLFEACRGDPRADLPLHMWTLRSDRQLPSVLVEQSLRQVLETPFTILQTTRGVGPTRLKRLLAVAERAVIAMQSNISHSSPGDRQAAVSLPPPRSPVLEPPVTPLHSARLTAESLTEEQWRGIAGRIRAHGLDQYPVGRFARSLLQLPRGLWNERFSSVTGLSLSELRRVSGYGEARLRQLLEIATDLSMFLSPLPLDTHYKVQVLPAAIRDLTHWIEHVLAGDELPDFDALRTHFVLPLIMQLETDLGPNVTEMIKRRLGVAGPPETLDQVAADFDLTRERIRQLTLRAPAVLQVRWPEGKYVLDDFYEKFRDTPRAHDQVELVRRVLDLLFAVSTSAAASYTNVLAEWETLGGRKQTPMTEQQICGWLASVFPHLPPHVGFKWISQEAQAFQSDRNGMVYFSNDPLDNLLCELYKRGTPTALSSLIDLDPAEERSIRGRIGRDIRILEDEFKRLLPADQCAFNRGSGEWCIELADASQGYPSPQEALTVASLAHLTTSGLLQIGIADATVWGVHRFANEMLGRMFAAKLPDEVTPFILADAFIRLTNGFIRPMRRRRLRWDTTANAIPARGKRGWVNYVITEAGIPVTLDEVGDLLRTQYQDYAPYVLAQLNFDAEEEGDYHCSVVCYPGVPHRIPPILVPADWKLDSTQDNVSEEIKLLVAKIVTMAKDKIIREQDLIAAAWLITLVERHSYGEGIWCDGGASKSQRREETASPEPIRGSDEALNGRRQFSQEPPPKSRSTREVDDLLSKFL